MSSTNYAVLLALGLLDDNKKEVPSLLGTPRKKYKQPDDNINPPSDGEDKG